MKSSIFAGVMILVGTIFVGRSLVRAQEPSLKANSIIIGTWKQNMEKSTYSPGPAPKGIYAVRQYAAGEDGSVVAVTMNVDAQGLPSLNAVAAANYDGREYVQYTVATLATQLGRILVLESIERSPINRLMRIPFRLCKSRTTRLFPSALGQSQQTEER